MLKLRFQSTVAALALIVATPVQAQLSGKLDAAEQKLAQDSQSCTPINLGDYQSLLNEAAKNKKRAEKAKKAGVPVDDAQVNADLAKASALFNRALAAHVQQCVRQATIQSAQPPSQAMNLSPFASGILAVHNSTRAEYGAPPLKWDPAAADRAGAWAGELARMGRLEHSPREGRGNERENIGQGPLGYSAVRIVNLWVDERVDFVPGTFPSICRSGGFCEGVLHFTQMIWPTTVAVGCGQAIGRGSLWVVCRYGPGGNKDGKMVGIPQTTILAEVDSKIEQPKLPVKEVFHASTSQASDRQASLFDLGIYAGGAWTTDWFTEPPSEDYANQIVPYLEYGYDPGLFVGYDFGAFRLESEVAYKKAEQAIDWTPIEDLLFRGSWAEGFGEQVQPDVDTTVEQPTLPKAEVYNANAPKVSTSDEQEPSNPPRCDLNYHIMDGVGSYDDAAEHYEAAKAHGNHVGMDKAKAEMGAGIASHRQLVEDAVAAGSMSALPSRSLVETLERMLAEYKELTGEPAPADDADGACPSIDTTTVEQPKLPTKEVFKPDQTTKLDDPM